MASARAGNPDAIAALNGPPVPDALLYLYRWAHELHGRSGIGPAGIAPLTPTTLKDWADMMGHVVHPHEAEALMRLDGVLSNPDATPDRDDAPASSTPRVARAWPTRPGSAPTEAAHG